MNRVLTHLEGLNVNYVTLLMRTIAIMLEQNTRQQIKLSHPDIVVQAPMKRYGTLDFDKAEAISQIGERKTLKAIDHYEQTHQSLWQQFLSLNR